MDFKTSVNKTGTLFYTRCSDTTNKYRVRFKSFQQAMFDNHTRLNDLE
jgi:hypothetical protein